MIYTNVRPSTAFIRVSRENQVQNVYVDQQGKTPSSLIRRDQIPTLRTQGVTETIPFNKERDTFPQLNELTKEASLKLNGYMAQSFNQCRDVKTGSPLKMRQEL
jgi:hypothetical protein